MAISVWSGITEFPLPSPNGVPNGYAIETLNNQYVLAPVGNGTIGGTIAANQVAFGSGANTITGSDSFVFDSGVLSLGGGIIQLSTDGQAYFSNGGNIFNANGSSALANGNASIDDAGNLIATSFAVGNGNFTAANDGSVYVATAVSIGGTLSTTSRLFISGSSGFSDSGITLYDGGTNDKDFAIFIADSIVHFAGAGLASPVLKAFFEMELLAGANIVCDGSTGTLTLDTNGILGTYPGLYYRNAGLDAGLVQEGSSVLSYGINVGQVGERSDSSTGAIFRFDMRNTGGLVNGQQAFILLGSPTSTSDFNTYFVVSMENGNTLMCSAGGTVGIGLTSAPSDKLDVNGTVRARGNFTLDDAKNIILGTSTGTKIGTGTTQKIGFYNATPVVQQTGNPVTALTTLGLLASPTAITVAQGGTGATTQNFPSTLFNHFADAGNTTTGETDLYSDTTVAGQLSTNGDKLYAEYAGIFVSSATATRQLRAYFGGTLIFDSGALSISAGSDAFQIDVTIIRESSTVVRCSVIATTAGASLNVYDNYTRVTGLTLSGTNILKITGQAAGVGAATNDIVAKLGFVQFIPA